ncbi:ATP-binding cassette domain-containing protein, partial [Clostridium perfringens]
SEGKVQLFGRPLDARDMDTRRRVGYMSQTFSLYSELTVRQNLVLHGQLFGIAPQDLDMRIHDAMDRYDLTDVADELP